MIGQTQVVLKPLDASLKNGNALVGAAIMGDGRVALVLDADGLAKKAARLTA